MKHTRARSLPHPLLSPLTDDVTPNTFELSCPPGSVAPDAFDWHIAARIHHQSDDLQAYVDRGAARFGVHVECPRTFFRKWFPQNSHEVKFALPATAVRGRVELLAMCVAATDIDGYHLKGQHGDYRDSSFHVRTGDCLAVAQQIEFNAFLDLDPIKKISSILDIHRSPDRTNGPAFIDLRGDRIDVELSQQSFRSYIELRADTTVRGLLVNGVVLPALLQAINYLCSLKQDQLEEVQADQRWCRSLVARLEKEGVGLNAGAARVFRAAQDILKDPISHGLADLLGVWKD